MTRRLLFLSLVLLSFPAFGQTGDLRTSIDAYDRVAATGGFGYVVHVTWDGAEPAQNVVLDVAASGTVTAVHPYSSGWTCTQGTVVHCTGPQLTRDEQFTGAYVGVQLPAAGTYTATATVSTTTPETDTTNNITTHTVVVAALPNLEVSGSFSVLPALDPHEASAMRVGITNRGELAHNVLLRMSTPEGGEILSVTTDFLYPSGLEPACSVENGAALCRFETLGNDQYASLSMAYRAPDRTDGGTFPILTTVDADEEDFAPSDDTETVTVALRRFMSVTHAADDGSGSLRQTMLDANAQCATTPCTISLAGIGTIQLASPLPVVTGTIRIDGGAGRAALDGSQLAAGTDGLVLSGACEYEVRNLVIRNVPHHAIEARQTPERADQCASSFLGFRTGLTVRDTELTTSERGLVAINFDAELAGNVIHENLRSGIFIEGTWYSLLHNNVIVNNGASGVFVNPRASGRYGIPSGTDMIENVVHGNAEFGIARTRNGLVLMSRNSLVRNGVYAYDVDLDLASPNRPSDAGGVPNKPVLLSATYDPVANATTIRGTAETQTGHQFELYASDSRDAHGGPQAERYLATSYMGLSRPHFEVTVPGDLRGQWITATLMKTVTLYFLRPEKSAPEGQRYSSGYDTSELSGAIQVQ